MENEFKNYIFNGMLFIDQESINFDRYIKNYEEYKLNRNFYNDLFKEKKNYLTRAEEIVNSIKHSDRKIIKLYDDYDYKDLIDNIALLNKNVYEAFNKYVQYLNEIYGNNDNVEISTGVCYGLKLNEFYAMPIASIKFHEITITNSKNQEHTLKDIVFHAIFCENEIMIKITRHSLFDYELGTYYSIYCFSHSSSELIEFNNIKVINCSNVCFGNTTIGTMLQEVKIKKFIDTDYELYNFASLVKKYLSWESLDGVPYVRIEGVIGKKVISKLSKETIIFLDSDFNIKLNDFMLSFVELAFCFKLIKYLSENNLIKNYVTYINGLLFFNNNFDETLADFLIENIDFNFVKNIYNNFSKIEELKEYIENEYLDTANEKIIFNLLIEDNEYDNKDNDTKANFSFVDAIKLSIDSKKLFTLLLLFYVGKLTHSVINDRIYKNTPLDIKYLLKRNKNEDDNKINKIEHKIFDLIQFNNKVTECKVFVYEGQASSEFNEELYIDYVKNVRFHDDYKNKIKNILNFLINKNI